jgi:DNA-binding winged helix-turn-helix (wHTH) protein
MPEIPAPSPGSPPTYPDPTTAVLDADGLLRFAGRWVAVPDLQLPIVELLVHRQGNVVRNEELLDAYRRAGGAATISSLRTLLHRLRTRLRGIGLTLHVIRGRGVLLEPACNPVVS